MQTIWGPIVAAKPDPILGIKTEFLADKAPNKQNLSIGAYNDDNGKQITLRCVREAERQLVETEAHKGYLSQCGDDEYCAAAQKLVFNEKLGEENETAEEKEFLKRIATVQSLSGTGAIRLALDFISRLVIQPSNLDNPFTVISDKNQHNQCIVSCSNPTWGNHLSLVESQSGILKTHKYRYYDPSTKAFNLNWMLEDLNNLANSIPATHPAAVLMHVCCHNPTGCDPNMEQWEQIAQFFVAHPNFIAIFDMAYQGFATGDLIAEAAPVRLFVKKHKLTKIMVCQSFAKNMGLYGERIGALNIICQNEEEKKIILSNLDFIVRIMYSSPPKHGAEIVKKILKTPALRQMWLEDLKVMVDRIHAMRLSLRAKLEELKTPGDWSHVTNQIGMFTFTGLNVQQVLHLKKNCHIFMTDNGRINVAGLNTKNVDYIAQCIHDVVVNPPK